MSSFNESHLEEAVIEWFQELGYEYANGLDIGPDGDYPERESYEDVILKERLREALFAFNKDIPHEALEEALREIIIPKKVSLIDNNKDFHKYLTEGITVEYRNDSGRMVHKQAVLFDYNHIHNNDFLVVNQFIVIENKVKKIPDVIVFINGFPLVVFELKSMSDEKVSISDAYNQIRTYQNTISNLFVYNAFSVISDGENAKAGTITSNEKRFMFWRLLKGKKILGNDIPQLELIIKGMFDKEILLNIIKHYIVFEEDNHFTNKILAGYHQYQASEEALKNTIRAISPTGDRRIGVVWHTQGSGKSLTMVFYSGKLVINEKLNNPTIVVITDRNDLDDQLFSTFSKSQDLLRNKPVQATDREHLRELLDGRTSGGIIFTTIHKFYPENGNSIEPLTNRTNVIVIADEAHRTQYGFDAKIVENKEEAYETFGYAKYMRDSLPNASYIGFTGTPIELVDRNTKAVFGDYIDTYDMTNSIKDKNTVEIYYESRIAKIDFYDQYRDLLDEEFDEITEYQEEIEKTKQKRKWAQLEAVVGSKERVKQISKDIVKHFEERQYANEAPTGKAMIVSMSRRIAVEFYKEITALRPTWHHKDLNKGKIKVVMTSSSSDPEDWQLHKTTKADRDKLSARMKDNKDELELVIVCDMWLTGFDVPSLHTMYIDKPMKGHNLMQAIARVNRVFKEKEGGLVVDYIGIADSLKKALSIYTETDRETTGIDTDLAVNLMMEKLDVIHDLLHNHDYSKFFGESKGQKVKAIVETADYIIGLGEKDKKDYIQLVTELTKTYSLCATTDQAMEVNVEIGFHKAVKATLIKTITHGSKKKTTAELDAELNQLISKSLRSDKVIDILAEAGLQKPNIAVLSDEFLEEFKEMEHKNLAVELLKKLIKGKIKAIATKSIIQSRKFSEMLEDAILKYQLRSLTTSLIIQELIDMAKEIMKAEDISKGSGLNEDEYAFYEALSSNMTAKKVMGTAVLKEIARELTVKIKSNTTVDWNIRESVRARIRMEVRRLLKKYDYPPDDPSDPNNYDKSIQLIMEQTELVCDRDSLD
ncbi:type I restriction endonuclease subunit R [Hujiaoplasma nucleasis]|uniref:Type I restriction enzyme endonuclease subunit n=1 Tax=Hujiaoplasma nucleasis TaxID=2725268 RepID=A0A7L6N394_9MOLU|nr:type I restriction endonuclease subunit R [Hujiaoplasma nucleasis]QLY40643.1 type I restriction endonuclease subunit R [Hujiaoplasma nucleasis]